ncbi:MAG: hypothetical protein IH849_02975 [Acidobacteria bacterium]|nr:hypothetical protein [Acidobacteriota bacterium]
MFSFSSRHSVACCLCLSIVGCLSIVLAAPAASGQQQQSEEMQIIRAAEQMVNAQQADEALAELQKIFDENDEFAPAYFVAGLAYAAKRDAPKAYENMIKATEYNPGWGQAHRLASRYAATMGDLDASWAQAIKAHQSGTDMSDAFEGLSNMGDGPDDLDAAMSAPRVFVGPVDTTAFEASGDTALQSGAGGSRTDREDSASRGTGLGRRVIQEAAPDIYRWVQEAKSQFSDSRAFGLVQRPEQAQYILIFEIDSMTDLSASTSNTPGDNSPAWFDSARRRRTRGYLKLVDAQSGEDAYRRRVDFRDIASYGDLNRDFSVIMSIMEEWAADQRR